MLPFLPTLLYAETHYRFPFFFSFLKKAEPEVVADAPHRLEPGTKVPLLLLAKDAHRYPAVLSGVIVTVRDTSHREERITLLNKPVDLATPWWWNVFELNLEEFKGSVELDVAFRLDVKGKVRTYHNDNYRTSNRAPLKIYLSETPLPRLDNLLLGDLHTHSHFTDDQVEYGSPPGPSRVLSEAMGLSFFAVTDHSYDLDDSTENYLVNDPSIPKWRALQTEIDALNSERSHFVILRGEEISCGNSRGKNVHLLNLGARKFLPGSGDSAERWFRTTPEHSVQDIIRGKESGTLLAAAHPMEPVPFLQRLFLGRDTWHRKDWSNGVDAFQFANGDWGTGFQKGKREWISSLLTGNRPVLLAGNDAHGNFNRFRQVGIPFFRIGESANHLWGKIRTGAFLDGKLTEESLLNALRLGRCIVTDGPVVCLSLRNQEGHLVKTGGTLRGGAASLIVDALSTQEFGVLKNLRVYRGNVGDSEEREISASAELRSYEATLEIPLQTHTPAYLRAEVSTSGISWDGREHFCMTNPVWLIP